MLLFPLRPGVVVVVTVELAVRTANTAIPTSADDHRDRQRDDQAPAQAGRRWGIGVSRLRSHGGGLRHTMEGRDITPWFHSAGPSSPERVVDDIPRGGVARWCRLAGIGSGGAHAAFPDLPYFLTLPWPPSMPSVVPSASPPDGGDAARDGRGFGGAGALARVAGAVVEAPAGEVPVKSSWRLGCGPSRASWQRCGRRREPSRRRSGRPACWWATPRRRACPSPDRRCSSTV